MKKEEIKKYFAKGKDWSEKERKDNTGWSLEDSSIEEGDVKKLEEELQIIFPKKYCEYIMAAAHRFTTLVGKFDNFFWVNHFSYGFSPKCFRLSPSCRHP